VSISAAGRSRDHQIRIDQPTDTFTFALDSQGASELSEPVTGTVNIYGKQGAAVFIDGERAGRIAFQVQLTEGVHTFKVKPFGPGATFEVTREIHFSADGAAVDLQLLEP
jgi:hypothetical protein